MYKNLGEESLGEKYMGEKYVQEEFLGEESLGEKSVQEDLALFNCCLVALPPSSFFLPLLLKFQSM